MSATVRYVCGDRCYAQGVNKALGHLYVHCVWLTHVRNLWLQPERKALHYAEVRRKCEVLKCTVIAANGALDHTHVLVRLWPTISVARLVQEIKGATSRLLNQRLELSEPFRWQ
jgi:putative transposase